MSRVKKFDGFRNKINEDTNVVEYDGSIIYKVNVICDVPAKLLSSYAKKVKQNTGKDIADQYSNNTLAEELVKYVLKDSLDADKIPATALIGGNKGQGQVQSQQPAQGQNQGQVQVQSTQAQPQSQVQSQSQGDFEDVQKSDEDLPL